MFKVCSCVRILDIQIAIVVKNLLRWDFPSPIRFLSFTPPLNTVGKLFVLEGLRLCVLSASFRQGLFVEPDVRCWSCAIKEQQVGWDACVWGKPTSPTGWVQNGFPQSRIRNFNHQPDHGSGSVKLPGIPGCIPHLFEHAFIKMSQSVNFFGRVKVNGSNLVDHVSQQVAAKASSPCQRHTA